MGMYDTFEKYLPEMKDVLAQYNLYLQENNLNKTAEEKLFDYLALISEAYSFNRVKMMTEFSMPNIANTLQKDNIQCMYGVISPIAERMRFYQMQDKAEFSLLVKNEIYEEKANIQISSENAWTYKRFPAHNTLYKEEKNKIVRFGLNVKPNIGLFKKLDDLCLKYDAFDYKIIDERLYNHRGDPIVIYAKKETQKEMQDELEKIVRPYRRRDEYDMVGYSNLGTGVFVADEVKKEDVLQLKYDILTEKEKNVFTHPLEDEFEQDDREYDVIKNIYSNGKKCPTKCALINWLGNYEYDYSLSSAQFQAAKIVVNAYKNLENGLSKNYIKQGMRQR